MYETCLSVHSVDGALIRCELSLTEANWTGHSQSTHGIHSSKDDVNVPREESERLRNIFCRFSPSSRRIGLIKLVSKFSLKISGVSFHNHLPSYLWPLRFLRRADEKLYRLEELRLSLSLYPSVCVCGSLSFLPSAAINPARHLGTLIRPLVDTKSTLSHLQRNWVCVRTRWHQIVFRGRWFLSLIHIWRCRRSYACRSRWSPYH